MDAGTRTLGKDTRCSIARTLEVVGEKWTLLIVREAFWGRTRFSEFRAALGIAPDVLTCRLATLVEHGVLARQAYREDGARERAEYVLTPAGRELKVVLAALAQWGDEHRPTGFGPAALYVDPDTSERASLQFVRPDGSTLDPDDVSIVRGPGSVTAE
ncbi:HxlR family transcriptional regulator [Actinomycetota bacterium]|nr:HxlR family transcriptional regulator [Actinomycetota bacterium]